MCQRVLRARMSEGNLPVGQIHEDVRSYHPTSRAARFAAAILAGFPCQAICLTRFRLRTKQVTMIRLEAPSESSDCAMLRESAKPGRKPD